jgi:hypothetical protein
MAFLHEPLLLGYSDLVVDTKASGRTYVTPEGKKYPSITTVLGSLNQGHIQDWRNRVGAAEANRVSKFAAGRGTALHALTEKYLNNEIVDIQSLMPHVRCLFNQVQPVLDRNVSTVLLQEKPLYSDHLGVAGRVDLVCKFKNRNSIVDFKTSSRVKTRDQISNYFMQETAYSIMVEERTGVPISHLILIMAVDNSPSEALVFEEKRDTWVPRLLDALKEFNNRKLFGHI